MDTLTKKDRSIRMSKIRSSNTKPELIVRKALYNKGLRFRVNRKDLPGKPDISVKKYKLLNQLWTIDKGELTPSLKVIRRAVVNNYAEIIESIYKDS